MIDYSNLRDFLAVLRTGSFEKAAAELTVTPSAVSRKIRQLEDVLGTKLVNIGPPCAATAEGYFLCEHIEQVRDLERILFESIPTLALLDDLFCHRPQGTSAPSTQAQMNSND